MRQGRRPGRSCRPPHAGDRGVARAATARRAPAARRFASTRRDPLRGWRLVVRGARRSNHCRMRAASGPQACRQAGCLTAARRQRQRSLGGVGGDRAAGQRDPGRSSCTPGLRRRRRSAQRAAVQHRDRRRCGRDVAAGLRSPCAGAGALPVRRLCLASDRDGWASVRHQLRGLGGGRPLRRPGAHPCAHPMALTDAVPAVR